MNDLHREIARLSPEQRKLVELMIKKEGESVYQKPILPIDEQLENPPLSFTQERFWYVDQYASGSSAYNVVRGIQIDGKLNVSVLEHSINEIIKRHNIFRIGCSDQNGKPYQFTIPFKAITITYIDLSLMNGSDREAEALNLASIEAQQPIALDQPPLLRTKLIRINSHKHILLLVTHHFVADADAMMLTIKEIAANYEALSTGKSSPFNELTIQYADFANWQRQHIQGHRLAILLSFWRAQLSSAPISLQLPTISTSSTAYSHRGLKHWFSLPTQLSRRIKELCRKDNIPYFPFFFAGYHILLHYYSSQNQIITSTDVSDRDRPELESLIGQFSSNLLLSSDFSNNPSLRDLINRNRRLFADAYQHRGLPFQKLAEILENQPRSKGIPSFRVMFNYYKMSSALDLSLPECTMSVFPIEHGEARSDLILHMMGGDSEFSGYFEYMTNKFNPDTIWRMKENLLALLEKMASGPERRISELIKLTEIKSPLDGTPDSTEIQAAQQLSDQALEAERRFIAPRTPYEKSLEKIWCVVLGLDRISIDDNFFELGGHSLIATNLVYKIHAAYGFYMPISQLFQTPTIAGLAEYVRSVYEGEAPSIGKGSLLPIQSQGNRRPIFFIPGGGGSEPEFLIYAPLIHLLGTDQPVYGLQARGLDGAQTPHDDIETMVKDYFTEMQTIQPEGPYLLVGECIGGKVAFELARYIQDRGEKVGLLVLMNTELIPKRMNPLKQVQYSLQTQRIRYHLNQLKGLTIRGKWKYLSERMIGRVFSISKDQEDQTGQTQHQVRDKYRRMLMGYRPKEGYSGKIALLVSEDHYRHNPNMGWEPFALGMMEIHELPGDHDSYIGANVNAAATILAACLDSALIEEDVAGGVGAKAARG